MKTISILLTKYSDFTSCLLYHIAGHGYTHASLGLDETDGEFYSFNYKGFCVETLEKHRRRGVNKSMCYQLKIQDEAYQDISQRVKAFEQQRVKYQYTRLGVIFAILHIPFCWKNHYICSQFVAELLIKSGAVPLRRNASLYLPNQLRSELEKQPQLFQVIHNPL